MTDKTNHHIDRKFAWFDYSRKNYKLMNFESLKVFRCNRKMFTLPSSTKLFQIEFSPLSDSQTFFTSYCWWVETNFFNWSTPYRPHNTIFHFSAPSLLIFDLPFNLFSNWTPKTSAKLFLIRRMFKKNLICTLKVVGLCLKKKSKISSKKKQKK